MGIVISSSCGVDAALTVGALICTAVAVYILLIPIDDRISSYLKQGDQIIITKDYFVKLLARRSIPDMKVFLQDHVPFRGMSLVFESQYPRDFHAYFFAYISLNVVSSIFINFCLEVYAFSTAEAGIALSSLGIGIATVGPKLASTYDDVGLVFWVSSIYFIDSSS